MNKYFVKFIVGMVVLWSFLLDTSMVFADQYDDYANSGQQHNVISDDNFLNVNSMTVEQIQSFLNLNGSWIKDYVDNSDAGKGRSAAQIIYDAAHGKYEAGGVWNGIEINETTGTVSPEVILVFLQKEQSLISRTTYNEWAMTASLGYNCFAGVSGDNNDNNCKDIHEGFTKQVENGAWQLRYNYEAAVKDDGWWDSNYPGQVKYKVGYTITAGTSRTPPDSYQVNLSNQATASCYRYTPYVFFGNYNVWNLFYNVYDFDSGSIYAAGSNDTSEYYTNTYESSISVSGRKSSDSKAFLEDTLIADIGTSSWSINREFPIGETALIIYYRDTSGNKLDEKKIRCKRHRIADITFDGNIDISDLAVFAQNWNKSGPDEPMSDFNHDNVVDITDLAILADNWEK